MATVQAARVGKIFAIALAFVGLFGTNFLLIAVALFIYVAASGEARYTALQQAYEEITVDDVMTPESQLDVVDADLSIEDLLSRMYRERHTGYPVMNGEDVVGIVTLDDIRGIPHEDRTDTRVGDAMTTELATLRCGDAAFHAMEALQRHGIGRVLVLDADGGLAGMITRSDLVTALDIGAVRGGVESSDAVGDDRNIAGETAGSDHPTRW